MICKIGKLKVDVLDAKCAKRPCFYLGFDKGSFTQGVGYTSYHRDAKGRIVERPVCWRRHMHGCPHLSVCLACNLLEVDGPGAKCRACGAPTSAYTKAEE